MEIAIRKWKPEDAGDLAAVLNNPNVLNNLRDGLPYPYTERDALEYINIMLAADPKDNFVFAVTEKDRAIGCISAFRQENIHCRTAEWGTISPKSIGEEGE